MEYRFRHLKRNDFTREEMFGSLIKLFLGENGLRFNIDGTCLYNNYFPFEEIYFCTLLLSIVNLTAFRCKRMCLATAIALLKNILSIFFLQYILLEWSIREPGVRHGPSSFMQYYNIYRVEWFAPTKAEHFSFLK